MKKALIFILLILTAITMLSSQEYAGWWIGGNFGVYGYGSDDCTTNLNIELEFPNFSVMHEKTGLLLTVCPFHFDSFAEDDEIIQQQNNMITGINAKLGIDILKNNPSFDLGPYIAINWGPILGGWNNYRAEIGIDWTFYSDIVLGIGFPLRVKVATLKTACGLRRSEPYFTVGASLDFGVLLHGALLSLFDDDDDYYYSD